MFEITIVSEKQDGTAAITSFSPNHIRDMVRGFLCTKFKPAYVASIDDEEAEALLHPAEKQAIIDTIIAHDVDKMKLNNFRVIDRNDIPKDRTFRHALMPNLSIDMVRAQEIQMDKIRRARDAALAELDKEQLIAQSKGEPIDAIAAEKQVLRDLPATFDLTVAATPEQLKALWPVELIKETP